MEQSQLDDLVVTIVNKLAERRPGYYPNPEEIWNHVMNEHPDVSLREVSAALRRLEKVGRGVAHVPMRPVA